MAVEGERWSLFLLLMWVRNPQDAAGRDALAFFNYHKSAIAPGNRFQWPSVFVGTFEWNDLDRPPPPLPGEDAGS